MADEKVFANGFYFKRNENAPDFVIGNLSVKVDEAIKFLEERKNKSGYVNLEMKYAKTGNAYIELNDYESKKAQGASKPPANKPAAPELPPLEFNTAEDDLPF